MERFMMRMLFVSCLAAAPFVLKRRHLPMHLTVFFAKGILSTAVDSVFIKRNKIEYPVRPFPNIFDTNILYDLLFYPLLSVIWVRWTSKSKPLGIVLKSLCFSVPMSIAQWIMEKRTRLFQWKSWSVLQTFAYINFTLFTIRALAGAVHLFTKKNKQELKAPKQRESSLMALPLRMKDRWLRPFTNTVQADARHRFVPQAQAAVESADVMH
ncbi:hypothetical protein PAESOLCIP111_03712 [Paenibacillus solanacearum]|uniref:Uncharacterized protein n=1 Tax=Paenibacillus solanacearum TaxID=2048548 RepID=A0A916K4I6_9BACL|nr:CBO0543 family protein [Paenibacillus solanacearum]CAG7635855.1 hypothetical protein PAESOLCIP111_03712 [Paenibacillus solanacearum]